MHERYPLQLRLTSCGHALPDAAIHVLPEPLHLEHRVVALTAGTHVWSWIHHAMPVPEVQARQSGGVDWACAAIANEIAVNDARELHEVQEMHAHRRILGRRLLESSNEPHNEAPLAGTVAPGATCPASCAAGAACTACYDGRSSAGGAIYFDGDGDYLAVDGAAAQSG